jgi:hypothetical protein
VVLQKKATIKCLVLIDKAKIFNTIMQKVREGTKKLEKI